MSYKKRPPFPPSRSYEVNVEDEIPLLRIHVVSARGLPRSAGAVGLARARGMPDPYVVVKFNGEKVGCTKADRGTRRPEWNQNFLIRSDLAEPAAALPRRDVGDVGDDVSNPDDDDNRQEPQGERNRCSCSAEAATGERGSADCEAEGYPEWYRLLDDPSPIKTRNSNSSSSSSSSSRCGVCRRRGGVDEVVLELWDEYVREDEKAGDGGGEAGGAGGSSGGGSGGGGGGGGGSGKKRRSSINKPNDLFDDRLFDVSFVSRCFQKGALRRVQGAVIGGDRLIGVCRISSSELRGLGSSTVPADLKLRDPRGSWWGSSRGTIRIAVSLERLQANIIRAALPPKRASVLGVPEGVTRTASSEAKGEEAAPPTELSCKVLWNGHDFSSPSRWDKVFCMTLANNQLWLDIRAAPDLVNSAGLRPAPSRKGPPPADAVDGADALVPPPAGHSTAVEGTAAAVGRSEAIAPVETVAAAAAAATTAAAAAVSPADTPLETLESPAASPLSGQRQRRKQQQRETSACRRRRQQQQQQQQRGSEPARKDSEREEEATGEHKTEAARKGRRGVRAILSAGTPSPRDVPAGASGETRSSETAAAAVATEGAPPRSAAAAAAAAAAAVAPVAASPVAAIAAAVATAAVAPAAVLLEGVLAVARSAARPAARREQRRRAAVVENTWAGSRSCILTVGLAYHLSTFDAQGLADMLNSEETSTERMAGTKEWHDKGFRLHWDPVRRRFTILNVSRRSFVLRGGCSSLATALLGFREKDHFSKPVAEAVLDPQHPSDPPRRHMGITGDTVPLPLLRPHWMRIVWGPPAMEITRGGELRVQVWSRQPTGPILRSQQRRRRRRSAIGCAGQSEDGSSLVGTAVLDSAEVCRLATGKTTRLPLLSPSALWQYERSKSAAAAAIAAAAAAYPALAAASSSSSSVLPVANGAGFWLAVVTAPRAFLARQRQRLRRLKRRIAAAGGAENGYRTTPLGAGGARVWWVLPPPPPPPPPPPAASKSRRHGSRAGGPGESMATPTGGGKHLRGRGDLWRLASGGDTAAVSPVEGEAGPAAAAAAARGGVVGHVWVSLKLRDPSMLMMRVVRQWNMARDEASVQQRRAAQLEAKRLWMFMPGISLWRVLLQLAGMSLLVSYCVTLTLRAFHSTRCRAAFNCDPETDPKLASLREWQTLADNMLSALSFLDMLLQFRTGYVDKNSKIIIDPKKVGLHYLRTWFIPDLWCSLPYGTMQPLLQPLLDEVEGAADSLSNASADHIAGVAAKSDNMIKATDSPLSMWVFKLSQRLHIGKINGIRGTRAFKYLDDSAMGVDLAVKQVVHVVRGRRRVLKWLGNPPKERGRIGKFFFRVGLTNKWTRIVLSYRLLGYAKVIGTLVRAMRVLAVAVRAVPRATRVLRLAAVFIRSYEGRRRSKDLHEASIVIQRRAGRHMALKVAGQLKTNLRRRTRARSESDIRISSTATAATGGGGGGGVGSPAFAFPKDNDDDNRSRVVSDAGRSSIGDAYGRDADASGREDGGGGRRRMMMPSPLRRSPARRRRGLSTPPRSPSLASDGGGSGSVGGWSSGVGVSSYSSVYRTPASVASSSEHYGENRPRSPSLIPSEVWSEDLSWDEVHLPRSPQRGAGAANLGWATEWDGHSAGTPTTPPRTGTGATR